MLLSRVAAVYTHSFYTDCVHTLHVCTIFGREINVAAKGIVKDTDSFPCTIKRIKMKEKSQLVIC